MPRCHHIGRPGDPRRGCDQGRNQGAGVAPASCKWPAAGQSSGPDTGLTGQGWAGIRSAHQRHPRQGCSGAAPLVISVQCTTKPAPLQEGRGPIGRSPKPAGLTVLSLRQNRLRQPAARQPNRKKLVMVHRALYVSDISLAEEQTYIWARTACGRPLDQSCDEASHGQKQPVRRPA